MDSSRAEFSKSAAKIFTDTQADFVSDEAVVFLGADYISLTSILLKPGRSSLVYQDADSIRTVPVASDKLQALHKLLMETAASGVDPINPSRAEGGLHEVCVVFSSHTKNKNSFAIYRISDMSGDSSPAARAYDLLQSILQK